MGLSGMADGTAVHQIVRKVNTMKSKPFGYAFAALLSLAIVIVGCAQPAKPPLPSSVPHYPEPSPHIAQSAIWAPDVSYLLADICPRKFAAKDNCTLYRYRLATQKWERLPALAPNDNTGYQYPAFSPDGKTIAATEVGYNCDHVGCPDSKVGARLVLLDVDGRRLKYLSDNGLRLRPTFSPDGKRILYWRGDTLQGGRAIHGFWDVYEMDIATGRERRMSNFAASNIAAPPRYWPDGKRILLVALDYHIKPNREDYRHPTIPNSYTTYGGIHRNNGSILIKPGEQRVWPFFKTEGPYVWLLVRDISPDGKWAVFDGRPGLMVRPTEDPIAEARTLDKSVGSLRSARYSPNSARLALVPEGGGYVEIFDIATADTQRIAVDW